MKKKALAIVLASTMVAGVVAGCGSAASAPASAPAASTEAAAASTEAAAATTEAAASDDDWASKIKFTASSYNEAAPDWSEYDKLISEIRTDTDLEDREAKMHQAEDMLMATGAVLPIYYYNDLYLEKEGFSGDFATVFGTKYFMVKMQLYLLKIMLVM